MNNADVESKYWRLLTTFCYFGPLSLDLLLHVFFLQRYSRLLEESAGRSPAHYSWLLAYAIVSLLCLSPMFSLPFLGQALSSTLVYIWSRRNPDTRLSFLGLLVFRAPFLPWVLIGFSFVMHGTVPKEEICGVVVGHGTLISHRIASRSSLTHIQFTISFQMSFRPCTMTTDRWILHDGGTLCSKEGTGTMARLVKIYSYNLAKQFRLLKYDSGLSMKSYQVLSGC